MSNPFTARIAQAAQEGYLPAKRTYPRTAPAVPTAPAPATPRQLDFMADLMVSRRFDGETRPKYRARVAELNSPEARTALTREAASRFIDYLLTLPAIERPAPAFEEVPVGRYAVEINDTLMFVKVERPEEGRWAGYTFVTRQLGNEFVKVSRQQSTAILVAIRKAGYEKAMTRYGRELGVCGDCGRKLTNEESRAAGIGPICRAKNGW